MKTKQILFLIILFTGFIVFASMRTENVPNNYHKYRINDTIDSLNNAETDDFGDLFESVTDDDLERANQELEGTNNKSEGLRQELERTNQELEQLNNRIIAQNKELVNLKIETEKLGEQIDSNEILEHLIVLGTLTSIDEVWQDYKVWLILKGFTKQDLEQN